MDEQHAYKWYPKPRNYVREAREYGLQKSPARAHPLASLSKATGAGKVNTATNGIPSKSSNDSNLPQSELAKLQTSVKKTATFIDPLLAMADDARGMEDFPIASSPFRTSVRKVDGQLTKEELMGPWNIKKEAILFKYTTTEKLTLSSSFLPGEEKDVPLVMAMQRSTSVTDKIQSRLEQLDNFEAGTVKEALNLTQAEYVARLDQLHHKLQAAWRDDQRVTALKIVIQLAKLLSDTAPLNFYPSKFVLITEVLETFGQLVHDRIQEKSEDANNEQYNTEFARETCRNWFFKVASVRELLPRIYIEISLMRCAKFVEPKAAYAEMIPRFVKMIRGIGDHLVASYVRCYLARMIGQLAPELNQQCGLLLEDFANLTSQVRMEALENQVRPEKMSVSSYWMLHQPALEWITELYGKAVGEKGLEMVLNLAEKNQNCKGLLVNCVLTSFDAQLVTKNPMRICQLIQQNVDQCFPTFILCRTFGLCLFSGDNDQKERKKIMNEIWPLIASQKDPSHYISAAEVWIEYTAKFFSAKEVNRLLADIIEHLTPDRAYDKCPSTLLHILERIVRHLRSFVVLLSMDKLMPFMDMLQQEDERLLAAKVLLEAFTRYHRDELVDAVVVNGVLFASRIVHDSITSLSSQDEKRNAAEMIAGFLRKVDFGVDFEQQLNFYAECRSTFCNLDDISSYLVRAANHLAMAVHRIQHGQHTRKTASFVRACIAFTFISIPSLSDIPVQLNLYLEAAQVALCNNCLGQADAIIKAAIQLLNSSKGELEVWASKVRPANRIAGEFASQLMALLLVVPDPPEQGVLYLVRGVLNVVDSCEDGVKRYLQIQLLAFLSAARQEEYLYHVEGVDSNDRLYGPDATFLQEVDDMSSSVITDLLSAVRRFQKAKQFCQAVKVAFDILDVVIAHADLERSVPVVDVLFGILRKHGESHDAKRFSVLRNFLQIRARTDDAFTERFAALL